MLALYRAIVLCITGTAALSAHAIEIQPRQWSHLPVDANFGGMGYGHVEADIGFDPVLETRNVDMEKDIGTLRYIHTFGAFGRSARVDVTQTYQEAVWQGLLREQPADAHQQGLGDTFVRFAINLTDSPALKGREYANHRAQNPETTIIGLGLAVRPQLGISRNWGRWTAELTTEVAIYGENDNFFNGQRLEQDPLFLTHAHLIYNFRPGFWLGLSAGYDYGGESEIDGDKLDDRRPHFYP